MSVKIKKLSFNQNVYINNYDGTFTPALFKGYFKDSDVCLVKPKEGYVLGGYGITITSLSKNILTEEQLKEVLC